MVSRGIAAPSLEGLPEQAQRAFYALGAFAPEPESFDWTAAEAVTGTDPMMLNLLIKHNLVKSVEEKRFALPQASAGVVRLGVPVDAVERHRDYYLRLAQQDLQDWQRIEREYAQIKWAWSAINDEAILDFVRALRPYQEHRELWHDAVDWAKRGLGIAEAKGCREETGTLLIYIGSVYSLWGKRQTALPYYEQALPIQKELEDQVTVAKTLEDLGHLYNNLDYKEQALGCFQEALGILKEVGDRDRLAENLNSIGLVLYQMGQKQKALEYFQEALSTVERGGSETILGNVTHNIGLIHHRMGRLEQALHYYEKARAMITYKGLLAVNLHVTGQIYYGFGQLEQAVDFFQRALLALSDVDNLYELAKIHKNLGLAYRRLGHPQQALNHLQQALDAVQKLGSHPDERTILYNLALLLLRQGRVVGAAIQLRHLIRRGLP